MPCPHSLVGDARQCSLCKGAVPRICTRDETTGILMIDGVPQDRKFALGPDPNEHAHYRRGAAASGRAKRKRAP